MYTSKPNPHFFGNSLSKSFEKSSQITFIGCSRDSSENSTGILPGKSFEILSGIFSGILSEIYPSGGSTMIPLGILFFRILPIFSTGIRHGLPSGIPTERFLPFLITSEISSLLFLRFPAEIHSGIALGISFGILLGSLHKIHLGFLRGFHNYSFGLIPSFISSGRRLGIYPGIYSGFNSRSQKRFSPIFHQRLLPRFLDRFSRDSFQDFFWDYFRDSYGILSGYSEGFVEQILSEITLGFVNEFHQGSLCRYFQSYLPKSY